MDIKINYVYVHVFSVAETNNKQQIIKKNMN